MNPKHSLFSELPAELRSLLVFIPTLNLSAGVYLLISWTRLTGMGKHWSRTKCVMDTGGVSTFNPSQVKAPAVGYRPAISPGQPLPLPQETLSLPLGKASHSHALTSST